jgi:hypothetical protein
MQPFFSNMRSSLRFSSLIQSILPYLSLCPISYHVISSTAVEAKALIGDITPKALKVIDEDDQTHVHCDREGGGEGATSEDVEKVKGSSWNHAGSPL